MKTINGATAAAITACGFSIFTHAQPSIVVVPYIDVGLTDYSLELQGDQPIGGGEFVRDNNTVRFDPMAIKVGLGMIYDRYYINASYQKSRDDSDIVTTPNVPFIPDFNFSGSREEWSLAAGYQLITNLSVFAGYRASENSATARPSASFNFEHEGPFLGAGYHLPLTDTGGLTFTAAYAWLDGEINQTVLGFEFPSDTGDGAGVKVGLEWRDYINQKWSYKVGVDNFYYTYDLSVVATDGTLDVKEEEMTISIGLSYRLF